jgi:hypothetical protein
MKREIVYISGQITGLEFADAYFKFELAEKYVNSLTNKIAVNPMKLEHAHDQSWASFMLEDIKALFECQAIYMLNNWESSKGARIERSIAIEMGIEIIYENESYTKI